MSLRCLGKTNPRNCVFLVNETLVQVVGVADERLVLYALLHPTPDPESTGFRSGLLVDHRSGQINSVASPAATAELSREHSAPVRCPAETRTCHQQCDA